MLEDLEKTAMKDPLGDGLGDRGQGAGEAFDSIGGPPHASLGGEPEPHAREGYTSRCGQERHDRQEGHPSLETLALLLEGALENDRLRSEIVPHFAAHCPVCQEALCEIERAKREVGHWSERVATFERRDAPVLWERIASLSFPEQLRAVAQDEDLQTWGVCSLLVRRSHALACCDPPAAPATPAADGAQKAARLALAVGAELEAAYGVESLADLRALCLAALANSHRALGEIEAAGDTFAEARAVLEREGSGDPRVAAEISVLEAALAYERRQFSQALAHYEQALALYHQVDLDESEQRLPFEALAGKAAVLREAGQVNRAISLLLDTLADAVPGAPEASLRELLQRDLLLLLITAGRYSEAESLLAEHRPHPPGPGSDRDQLRLRACAGLIAYGLGRYEEAERILQEVKEGLLDLGLGYDAAIVTLELATLYADLARQEDLLRLSQGILACLLSDAVHREAIAAIVMFQDACEREKLTVQLARHLSNFLRRERLHTLFHPPPAGFPGPGRHNYRRSTASPGSEKR